MSEIGGVGNNKLPNIPSLLAGYDKGIDNYVDKNLFEQTSDENDISGDSYKKELPTLNGFNIRETKSGEYNVKDNKRAEDYGLVSSDSVTLNYEQQQALLEEAGYDTSRARANVAKDGTVSFHAGNQHVRVVADPSNNNVSIIHTTIEDGKAKVKVFGMNAPKANHSLYQPTEGGNLNPSQINALVKDVAKGKTDLDTITQLSSKTKEKVLNEINNFKNEVIKKQTTNEPQIKEGVNPVVDLSYNLGFINSADDLLLFTKDTVTLNQEQQEALLKEVGFDTDKCIVNKAENGTVSFQFGNQHYRVVADPKTNKVSIAQTTINGNKSNTKTYDIIAPKADHSLYQPDKSGKLNDTQVNAFAQDVIDGKADINQITNEDTKKAINVKIAKLKDEKTAKEMGDVKIKDSFDGSTIENRDNPYGQV